MTRKHFQAFADAIKAISDTKERATVAEFVANVCADQNPRFNRSRFMAACEVNR